VTTLTGHKRQRNRRPFRIALWVLALIVLTPLILLSLMFLPSGCGRPVRLDLPPGYRGWVVIQHGDPSCPPLRIDWPFVVISVWSSGQASTSTPELEGWRFWRYMYVRPDGARTSAPRDWGYSIPEKRQLVLFVGTEAEREASWDRAPH